MTDGTSQQPTSPVETTSSPAPVVPATSPTVQPTEPSLINQPVADTFVPLTAESFKAPEGFTLDPESMTGFLGIMNNRDLTPAQQAEALIELQANITTKSSEAGSQAWNEQQQAWQQEVENDPDLGGAKLQTTLANVGRVMDKFATPEIRAAFDTTGAGNNPQIVRFLNILGQQFAEAGPTPPGAPTNTGQRSLSERIFGNSSNPS